MISYVGQGSGVNSILKRATYLEILLNPINENTKICLVYTSPSPRDYGEARMPSSAWKKKKNLFRRVLQTNPWACI